MKAIMSKAENTITCGGCNREHSIVPNLIELLCCSCGWKYNHEGWHSPFDKSIKKSKVVKMLSQKRFDIASITSAKLSKAWVIEQFDDLLDTVKEGEV